jgi:colanic acid/amylovoran biosynthesis glycosyltransferase
VNDRSLHLLEIGVRWPPETFIGWKLEGMAARGMRVTVASRTVFDPGFRLQGVELSVLPDRPRTRWAIARATLGLLLRAPGRALRLVRNVRRAPAPLRKRHRGAIGLLAICLPLARARPDIVHFEWHGAAIDYLPLFDVWGCPVVTSARGSDTAVYPYVPGREHYAATLPAVMRAASAVHCVAESTKREAIELGLDPAKARVIRPADDPELFRPATGADRNGSGGRVAPLRMVTLGWLRWEKGHEYVIEALRLLIDSRVPARLDVIGGVPEEWRGKSGERERIIHTARDLGVDHHVHLHGFLDSSEVSRRLQASDVLLHGSVTEGIPNAIVEAMACAVPVVAADSGGVSEAITDGVEGIVVPPRDPEQMAAAVLGLWRAPKLRRRMGDAGRAKFLSEFTLEREHDAFMAMYREVVAG